MTAINVATLAELRTALTTAAANGQADTITLTANISAVSGADFVAGTDGNDLLKIAITDGQTLSIVGGGFTLDANYFGRVLEVSSGTVAISNLTIREGGLAGSGGDTEQYGGTALGAGIYNAGDLTLSNVTVTANTASGGGGGGASGYANGGGGGAGGIAFAGAGGSGISNNFGVTPGSAASGTTGGAGGAMANRTYIGGGGGSTTGGGGGLYDPGNPGGGAGGTATIGGLSIGGGGGGGGYYSSPGDGGTAVGGIYNAGTLRMLGGTVTGNLAAGGGGGGGYFSSGGSGGAGVGGIQNVGLLRLDNASVTGNVGVGGFAGVDGGNNPGSGVNQANNTQGNVIINHAHTGAVSFSGTATQGQTLTAANTLADTDTLGTISYQWTSDGADISGATSATLVLSQAQVGHVVAVTGRYTDGAGFAESATSSGTAAVANINDAPTGSVTISGVATLGQVLTAANTLADADGLGTITYQWKSDGSPIGGATSPTLTLTSAQVGHAITVTANYTDGGATAESVTSTASALVIDPSPAPTAPPPVTSGSTVDGTGVSTTTTTALDGSQSQTISVAPVATGRTESGGAAATADIPLVTVGGVNLLTIGLPTGTGLSASGAAAPQATGAATPGFIVAIDSGFGGADRAATGDGVNAFLQSHAGAPVLVQTLTLTGSSTATPIAINGSALGSGVTTALVIDTHHLPGATVLTLDNVDFAAVIGAVHITGGAGSQTVFADGAAQYIVLGADDDALHGGAGDDTIGSAAGADSLFGDDGQDYVFGGIGHDAVNGGSGNDVVQGNSGDDFVQGNAGDDLVYGGQGNDVVRGGQGEDQAFGDLGDDQVFGDLGNDTLNGGEGADIVQGNQGNDLVQGGAGADLVYGGQGADTERGGDGNDQVFGDLGDDLLSGDKGADTLTGGAGADTFVFAAGDGADRIIDFRQSEGDHLQLSGPHGVYTTAQAGADTVVDFGGGQVIVLANVQLSTLTSGWITG